MERFPKAIKHEDKSEKIHYRTYMHESGGILTRKTYRSGTVATDYGYVRVNIWSDDGGQGTVLSFIVNGRRYNRRYPKALTQLGAIRKACEFAKQVVEGK